MSPDASGCGCLAVVVGPSGVGKDSLIDFARAALGDDNRFVFVRRVITRPASSGGEDHIAMDMCDFARRDEEGAFAVTWQAHGLSYALPSPALVAVRQGRIAIANGSRGALPRIRAAFPRTVVIGIEASPEVLSNRLAGRARETADQIRQRLERSIDPGLGSEIDMVIENNAALGVAGNVLVKTLLKIASTKRREAQAGAFVGQARR